MESTVIFSSGLVAGKTISSVLSDFRNIYLALGTHPAINFENHNYQNDITFHQWSDNISNMINSSDQNEFVIACDSINVLTSEIHDLSFIKNLIPSKKVIALIDDSHGIGVIGKNGEGIVSQLHQQENIEYIISYSLSKAFNITGGAVSCSKSWAQKLRQHPNYTASTSINPSLIHAYLNAKDLYAKQREKLFKNIDYMKGAALRSSTLQNNFDLPVFICSVRDAEEYFYNNGIIISSFRYPYPSSEKINRIIVSALHTTEDIDRLISLL
jgi:7-keto-8-aminopelargonate synthetase-like enzyme